MWSISSDRAMDVWERQLRCCIRLSHRFSCRYTAIRVCCYIFLIIFKYDRCLTGCIGTLMYNISIKLKCIMYTMYDILRHLQFSTLRYKHATV